MTSEKVIQNITHLYRRLIVLKPFPDNWGKEPLSEFIDNALHNTFATFTNLRKEYAVLETVDSLYRRAIDNLINTPDWFIAFFLLILKNTSLNP